MIQISGAGLRPAANSSNALGSSSNTRKMLSTIAVGRVMGHFEGVGADTAVGMKISCGRFVSVSPRWCLGLGHYYVGDQNLCFMESG